VAGDSRKCACVDKEYEGMDGHAVESLGLADDSEDEVGKLGRGFEKQPPLQRTSGDLDEGPLGDESKWSRHTGLSARMGTKLPPLTQILGILK
jgi:hypothetical protein